MFITKQAAEVFKVWNQQQQKSLKRKKKEREAYKELTKPKPRLRHWGKVERDVEHEIWSKAKGLAVTATTERKTYGVYNPMQKRKRKKVERITGIRICFIVICQVTLFRGI